MECIWKLFALTKDVLSSLVESGGAGVVEDLLADAGVVGGLTTGHADSWGQMRMTASGKNPSDVVALRKPETSIRAILSWPDSKQEAYKRRLIAHLMEGFSLREAIKDLGLTSVVIGQWRECDDRVARALAAWEHGVAIDIQMQFEDVAKNPAKYDAALRRPMWFNFNIALLKGLDRRFADNAQISIDNRSITIGDNGGLAGAVGTARDDKTIIEGVKKQLLKALPPPKR